MATLTTDGLDYNALVRGNQIHGSLYSDPAIFEQELERIWGRVWVYLGHDSEVPRSGDYLRRTIGRQPVLLVRDDDAQVRAFYNRCRHRANLVCHLEKGNAKSLKCPYHGWSYATDGRLLGRTFDEAYGGAVDIEKFGLTPLPRCASYRGLIFGSLSAGGVTLDDHLGAAKEYLDLIMDRSPTGEMEMCVGVQKGRYSANWKMLPENSLEGMYHGRFIHNFTFGLADKRTGYVRSHQYEDSARYLAGGHMAEDFRHAKFSEPEMRTSAQQQYFEALVATHGEARVQEVMRGRAPMLFVFPNLMYIQTHFRRVQPVSVNETYVYYQPALLKGAPIEINRELLRHHEGYFGPAGFLASDDMEILERSQTGIEATGNEWLFIGRGSHREKPMMDGGTAGHSMDENHLRGMWRHYAQIMTTN